jgi:hypothetical protein
MPLRVNFNILNQKGTPAFYSDIFANRPAAGYAGRVFISTDTGAIYEDNGSTWTLIADAGAGTTGTLQQVTTNGNTTTQGITITAGGLSSNSINNTALTTGSVLFSGAAGLITQDNANLFWDDTNNRLGIGTGTPGAPLDIHSTGTAAQFNGTGTNNAFIRFQNAGSNKWTIGNQYAGGVNNFTIENNAGNSVINITGGQQVNLAYNATIAQTLTLNGVGDQLRLSSGLIDARLKTSASDNNLYIGATSITTNGINIDLSTGSLTATNYKLTGQTGNTGLYWTSNRVTVANYNASGTVDIEVNGGASAATFNADLSTTLKGSLTGTNATFIGDTETLRLYTPTSTGYTSLKIMNDLVSTSRMFEIKYYGSASSTGESAVLGTIGGAPVSLITSNTERIRATAAGNIGIGNWSTNNPLSQLHTTGDIQVGYVNSSNDAMVLHWNGASSYGSIQTYSSSALALNPAGNNVLIGTTTDNGIAKLQITGSVFSNSRYYTTANTDTLGNGLDCSYGGNSFAIRNGSTTTAENFYIDVYNRSTGTWVNQFKIANNGGAVTLANLGTGTVTATSGTLSTVSDMNLKIEDGFIDNALNKVMNLQPRYFKWKKESGLPTDIRQLGFYAQEVNKALGEEAANTPNDNKNWGIIDRSVIAMLTKAIQELNEKLERNNIN